MVEADNNSSSSSLFKVQPGVEQAENDLIELRNAVAQGRHVLQRLDPSGLGPRRKSFADILHVIVFFILVLTVKLDGLPT